MKIERIALKYGLMTFALLGIYFLIMKTFGLIHIFELRLLNGVIMFGGVYMAIQAVKKQDNLDYAKGMGTGVFTGIIASVLFALFGLVYLTFINPNFMESIKENELLGMYQNPMLSNFQIFIEGVASSVLFSFAVMQLEKKPGVEYRDDRQKLD